MNNVVSTNITLFRNLKDYKFVPKIEQEKKIEIIEKVSTALKGKYEYINLSKADDKLIESLQSAHIEYSSQHVFVDKDKKIIISLFEDEHMTIKARVLGFDKSAYKSIQSAMKLLNDKISLAYSDEYGYLMSDISRVGAGLHITSEICLPNLKNINKIEQVKKNISKLRYKLIEVGGDTFSLQTTCNLGFGESEIMADFEKMLNKICDLEVESAKMLNAERPDEVLDQVVRCVAILSSAHLLSPRELRGHISTLRTAKNLSLTDVTIETINQLQGLATGRSEEFISLEELRDIANKTKEIIKGV